MRIATFNVNGVRGRLDILLRWLERRRPDVVCLQELKAPQDAFPLEAIEAAGYGAVWSGQSRWNGVAILCRGAAPVPTRRRLPGDRTDDQARYVEAACRGVLVGCLYAPNGNPAPGLKLDYKLAWLDRFERHARSLIKTGAPVVLAGDYNIIPDDLDVWAPDRWRDDALFRPEIRAVYGRLTDQGWVDALRTLHPDAPVYTFWDYKRRRFDRDAGLRIDHLLLSPDVGRRLRRGGVDRDVRAWEGSSDHAPAWLELGRRASGALICRRGKTAGGRRSAFMISDDAAGSRPGPKGR
jgi:exodeoxyribonuclease III